MPQLHNETPSAKIKRLTAELANERATCATLIEALTDFLENPLFQVAVGGNPNAVEKMLERARAALKQATGKGL